MRLAVLLIALIAGTAHADKPWERGVPAASQDRARALYAAGNEKFKQQNHAAALALYEQALGLWDHPLIHINAAATCIELDRLLRAAEHLEGARRYRDHLDPSDRRKLDEMIGVIASRTSTIRVTTAQRGVAIAIDGVQVMIGPGSVERRVLAGQHIVVARRANLVPDTRELRVEPGGRVEVAPVLYTEATEWRLRPWLPWAIVGAGALVAAAGVPLVISARSRRQTSNDFADANCPCPPGDAARARELRSAADRRELHAIVAFAAGGAIGLTGLTLAIINRPRQVRRRADAALWLGPDRGGLVVRAAF